MENIEIDELRLLNYQSNQMEANPIAEELEEGDPVHIEDNDVVVKSDDIYVGRLFRDEMKRMMLITHTRLRNHLVPVKEKPLNLGWVTELYRDNTM